MKVSYKQIRRVTPVFVDHYYSMTLNDFHDDDEIAEMQAFWIYDIIKRGQEKRAIKMEG